MRVVVNGTPREVPDTLTLAELLALLGLEQAPLVAEVSGQIVLPEAYATTVLKGDDRVELVRFVGGG
ncbi:MAG: sulfur carrier protein ThiS [bacterium]|nr:sulfur carrier protein ThiS [bacterium]